ncbi:heparinase II/III family protein [Paenibacillus sp. YYML68]|uniref:heparinase II/III domain-containing protein n=1 Tax=Paenibacillus sp. YYML68 TaxID=2909250 RepID=UPI002491FE67|nr:heparinase II/III family protein [Paenibacillus sp. YYML68]
MRIYEKLQTTQWSGEVLEQLRKELDAFAESGMTIPHEPGGWWHQYVCPEHHAELLFNPFEANAEQFHCPHGCVVSGEPYRGGWLVFKHQSLARYALQAAAVYAGTHDARYAELGRTIITSYALQFPNYPVHPDAQPWMLKGRAFHQALTEAIWSTTLIRAYLLLLDEGVKFDEDAEPLTRFFAMLEESMTLYRHILIHERKNAENNYTAWLNASLASVYAATGKSEKLSGLIGGEGGIRHHLTIGVMPDQFEFEGSTYYHVFVLRAYLIAAEMAERMQVDIFSIQGEQGQTYEGMLDVLAAMANDQGELPALHDGPYARVPYAREIAEVFEIGYSKYKKAAYLPVLAEAYRQLSAAEKLPRVFRCSLESLVYGEQEVDPSSAGARQATSLLLPESGFAIGRTAGNPLSFLVDFGPHGGSHGHYDKLHISLEHRDGTLAPELGMVPYGSNLRKDWYAETASHNTVSVGGRSQQPHTGELMKWQEAEGSVYGWLRSTEAYEGAVMNRHLYMNATLLVDVFQVELEKSDTIDWWYHGAGTLTAQGAQAEPSAALEFNAVHANAGVSLGEAESAGYAYVRSVSRHVTEQAGEARAFLQQSQGAQAAISLWCTPYTELHQVVYPGTADDPSRPMSGICIRTSGLAATFIAVYQNGDAPAELDLSGCSIEGGVMTGGSFVVRAAGQAWKYSLDQEQGLRCELV